MRHEVSNRLTGRRYDEIVNALLNAKDAKCVILLESWKIDIEETAIMKCYGKDSDS